MKYYVVRNGKKKWIFDSWDETKVIVEWFQNAKYKSFDDYDIAKKSFDMWYDVFFGQRDKKVKKDKKEIIKNKKILTPSICVDASCMGNPGNLQYQIVDTGNLCNIYKSPIFEHWTQNIWEYMAIVHWMMILSENDFYKKYKIIYSDSNTAISWIVNKKPKTSLIRDIYNIKLKNQFEKTNKWLLENTEKIKNIQVIKRETKYRWEILADFGRK